MYVQQLICDLHEQLDVPTFTKAWRQIVERHSVFRTSFHWDSDTEPHQTVHQSIVLPFEWEDVSRFPHAQQEQLYKDFIQADREQGFQHDKAPLMRFKLFQYAQSDYKLVWTFHHALLDGRALVLVLRELFQIYEGETQGKKVSLDQSPDYQDYIHWLETRVVTGEEVFWRQLLKGFPAPTPLGVARLLPSIGKAETGHEMQSLQLSENLTSSLRNLAQKQECTLNTILLGAWALLLSRYSGELDVVFGVTRTGRSPNLPGAASMVGLLINTIPFRISVSPHQTVLAWLKELRSTWRASTDFQHTPLLQIQEWSEVSPGLPLFESLLVFEHEDLNTMLRAQGKAWEYRHVQLLQHTNYPITLAAHGSDRLSLIIEHDPQRFEADTINRMLGHLHVVLEGMANHPTQCLAQLRLLTTHEAKRILVEWNDTQRDFGQDRCIHQRVESQVTHTPDALAVTYEDQSLTYLALNQRGNQLAHHLRHQGVGPEVLVGLCMENSLDMIIGLLGILKAGGAYVPLNPAYPADRLEGMLKNSRISFVLTQEDFVNKLPELSHLHLVCLDRDARQIGQEQDENPHHGTLPDNLAYVIYTSGSTGRPKGVMVSHRAIGNRLSWGQKEFQLNATDRVLQKDSVSFDTSIWKFFTPLFVGARVVIAPSGAAQDPRWLGNLIARHQITTTGWTPSALQIFLDEPGSQACPSLREVLCGGELLPPKTQERFFTRLEANLHNLYGPTEASIDVSCWECRPSASLPNIPMGRPIANTQIYLLDRQLTPVPIGVPGDLYIGGTGLARGYDQKPDLTADRFIPNFLSDRPGTRLYRTGDVAVYLPDGNIEFRGRRDQQVKLRGYRIELDEIQMAIARQTDIEEAVVMLREDRPDEKRLVAYVVMKTDAPFSATTLRHDLRKTLPDYMIPSAIVRLESLPLTTHGKVDRQVLPVPDEKVLAWTKEFVAPTSPQEVRLATLWEDVLQVKRVGLHDNFFALGGHSLLAFNMINRIRKDFNVILQVRTVFDNPTLEDFARVLTSEENCVGGSRPRPSSPTSQEQTRITYISVGKQTNFPAQDLSEHDVTPDLILVHNPCEFNAFQQFSSAVNGDELLKRFLFRDQIQVDQYHEQHTQFVRTLSSHVPTKYLSELLDGHEVPATGQDFGDNPNQVFTHDAFLTIPWIPNRYILGNMKQAIRQKEAGILRKVGEKLGLQELVKIPPHLSLEGGDVIPFCYEDKKALLVGYGPRTSRDTLFFLRETLIKEKMVDEIIGFHLAPWRLNLDGCFFPVSRDLAVCNKESILGGVRLQDGDTEDINPLGYLQKIGLTFIEASKEESYEYQACNFVCLGNKRFIAYNMTDRINDKLRNHGLEVIGVQGDQLVKGNGGPHCMTRPIYLGNELHDPSS